jgi:hypothetical protein
MAFDRKTKLFSTTDDDKMVTATANGDGFLTTEGTENTEI